MEYVNQNTYQMRILLFLCLSLPLFAQDEIVETLGTYQERFSYDEFTGHESVNFHFTRHSFPGTDSVAYYLRVFVLNPNRVRETALFNAPYQDIYVSRAALAEMVDFLENGPNLALRKHTATYWEDVTEGLRIGITVFPKGSQSFNLQFYGAQFGFSTSRRKSYIDLRSFLQGVLNQWPEGK